MTVCIIHMQYVHIHMKLLSNYFIVSCLLSRLSLCFSSISHRLTSGSSKQLSKVQPQIWACLLASIEFNPSTLWSSKTGCSLIVFEYVALLQIYRIKMLRKILQQFNDYFLPGFSYMFSYIYIFFLTTQEAQQQEREFDTIDDFHRCIVFKYIMNIPYIYINIYIYEL